MNGPSRPKRHHLVSRCYQQQWADSDGKIAVISKERKTWNRADPKNSFREKNFLTYYDERGAQSELEDNFANLENEFIGDLRRLISGDRDEDANIAGIIFCAVHWARSLTMESVAQQAIDEVFGSYSPSAELQAAAAHDPDVELDDLAKIVREHFETVLASKRLFVEHIHEAYEQIRLHLIDHRVQRVQLVDGPVTFVAADVPVVMTSTKRLGGTAAWPVQLRKAGGIWFPLSPKVGISFSKAPVDDLRINEIGANDLNNVVWRHAHRLLLGSPRVDLHLSLVGTANDLREWPKVARRR